MSKAYRHFYWLVFLIVALTASLPWWSRVPFSSTITFQTIMLSVLALAWLIIAAWWNQTSTHFRLALSFTWKAVLLEQLICLIVLAGAIFGAWWVSCFPWLHLVATAHLLFLLALVIGGVSWFILEIAVFWVMFAYDLTGITIAHSRSQRVYRRRRGLR